MLASKFKVLSCILMGSKLLEHILRNMVSPVSLHMGGWQLVYSSLLFASWLTFLPGDRDTDLWGWSKLGMFSPTPFSSLYPDDIPKVLCFLFCSPCHISYQGYLWPERCKTNHVQGYLRLSGYLEVLVRRPRYS